MQKEDLKVIFLDVDGVLTHEDYLNGVEEDLDREKITLLKQIVEQTNAKIVLSSTWRKCNKTLLRTKRNPYKILEKLLKEQELEIYDCTPVLQEIQKINNITTNKIVKINHKRAKEILLWIERNNPESYVILDDNTHDFIEYNLDKYQIQTNYYDNGLKQEHVNKAIEILNKTNNKIRK